MSDFLARNMQISEFSKFISKPTATVRDWNKRGMAVGIGQPGPNGHWLYSKEDVLSVSLAQNYKDRGFDWSDALWIGHIVSAYLVGDMIHPGQYRTPGDGGYGRRYLIFYRLSETAGMKGLAHIATDNPSDAFTDILSEYKSSGDYKHGKAPPVFHVIDLIWTFNNLEKFFQNALVALKPADGTPNE